MINREQLKPGTWIVQNLIKHQNDYMIMRVDRSEKSLTFFNKMIVFGIHSFNDEPMKARIGRGFDIPTYSIISKPQFSLLKNASKRYKKQAIRAVFKDR